MQDIPRKQSYSYLEWHCQLPRNKPLSEHGNNFNNIMMAGGFVLIIPAIALTCFVMIFVVRAMEWPKAYHGIGGGIMVVLNVVIYLALNYLAYPMMGKMVYKSGRIDEEEYRWIKQRRIPGSFLLPEPESNKTE